MKKLVCPCALLLIFFAATGLGADGPPKAPGKLVDVGGHRMHFHCTGGGSPTVVVEYGLGDISTNWSMVQSRVSKFTRICTYDRAGYAWSEPGPLPRTYTQLNLELHEGLRKLGERGPFVLVGHSFGGPVVRNYAATYPEEVAGMVLVDTVQEDQRIVIGDHAIRLRASASGRSIPAARLQVRDDELKTQTVAAAKGPVEAPMDKLAAEDQKIYLWAVAQPSLQAAEDSQREWSAEFLAKMYATPQQDSLQGRPLIVLTRAHGGYGDTLDVPAATLENERLALQRKLAGLSANSKQIILNSGHNMHVEAPDEVTAAIHTVVGAVRTGKPL